MFSLITDFKDTLTPEKAFQLLKLNSMESQRKLSSVHVDFLAGKITSGLFRTAEIAVAQKGWNGNQEVLANGQHTCHAVLKTQTPVKVNYFKYRCPTPSDLSLLFRQFDTHRARTLSDFVRVEGVSLGFSYPTRLCSLVVSASILEKNGNSADDRTERACILKDNVAFLAFCSSIVCGKRGKLTKAASHMLKSPVINVLKSTYQINETLSRQFWISVRDGENLKKDDPTYHLRNWLLTTVLNRGVGSRLAKKATNHEYISRSIIAWNAYQAGRKLLVLKYYPDRPIPAIEGK